MAEPRRILYVMPSPLWRAGTESYAMNYYRHFDRSKLQVDFLVHGYEKGDYDDEVTDLGGRIYHVPRRGIHLRRNEQALREFFATQTYDIVHVHMDAGNYLVLKIAREAGVPIRISHSHNTDFQTDNPVRLAWDKYQRARLPRETTNLCACSQVAARWLYGEALLPQVKIVPNAIDLKKFAYDAKSRQTVRQELNIEDNEIAVGHIGRFIYQKNHVFLVTMFADLCRQNEAYKLILIGEGDERASMERLVDELGIASHVVFVGATSRVAEYYSAFDLFVLPSHFEGLPVVAVEAQANGLHCLLSDAITRETGILAGVDFLPVEGDGANSCWVQRLLELGKPVRDVAAQGKLDAAGYNIETSAAALQETYEQMLDSLHVRVAYVADTPYQVLNCMSMADEAVCKPVLFLGQQFRDAGGVSNRLRQSGLFERVVDFYPERNDELDQLAKVRGIANPDLRLRIMTDVQDPSLFHGFSEIRMSMFTYFSAALAFANEGAKVAFFDDGIGSYLGDIAHIGSSLGRKVRYGLFGHSFEKIAPRKLLLNRPDFVSEDSSLLPVEPLPALSEESAGFWQLAHNVFAYSGVFPYGNFSVVYLSQPVDGGAEIARIDSETVRALRAEHVDYALRPHPRELTKTYGNVPVDVSNDMWELVCQDSIQENTTLLGYFSTAQFTPHLLYGKEPKLIFTFGLAKDAPTYDHFAETVERLKMSYQHPERIFVPKSLGELRHALRTCILDDATEEPLETVESNPKVSLVATFYNLEDCVDYCVKSLLKQTYTNLEIVLVDDGSSDGTASALDAYAQLPNVIVCHIANGGPAAARNYGVRVATGDYVTFVDGDDYVHSEYVEYLIAPLVASGAGMAISKPEVLKAGLQLSDSIFHHVVSGYRVRPLKDVLVDVCHDKLTFASWGCMARREQYLNHPFPAGMAYEDVASSAEQLAQNAEIAQLMGSVYGYVMRGDSVTNKKEASIKQARDFVVAIDSFCDDARTSTPDIEMALAYMQALNIARLHDLCKVVSDDPATAREIDRQVLEILRILLPVVKADPVVPSAQKLRFDLLARSPRVYDRIFVGIKKLVKGV